MNRRGSFAQIEEGILYGNDVNILEAIDSPEGHAEIGLFISENRMKIRLVVNGESAEINYDYLAGGTLDEFSKMGETYEAFLVLARKLRSSQQQWTAKVVSEELAWQKDMECIPEIMQPLIRLRARVYLWISLTIKFKTIFVQRTLDRVTVREKVFTWILQRIIREMLSEKDVCEAMLGAELGEETDTKIQELIELIIEVQSTLNQINQAVINRLKSEVRTDEII